MKFSHDWRILSVIRNENICISSNYYYVQRETNGYRKVLVCDVIRMEFKTLHSSCIYIFKNIDMWKVKMYLFWFLYLVSTKCCHAVCSEYVCTEKMVNDSMSNLWFNFLLYNRHIEEILCLFPCWYWLNSYLIILLAIFAFWICSQVKWLIVKIVVFSLGCGLLLLNSINNLTIAFCVYIAILHSNKNS